MAEYKNFLWYRWNQIPKAKNITIKTNSAGLFAVS